MHSWVYPKRIAHTKSMRAHFLYGNFVFKPSYVVYYDCDEEFVEVVVLGAQASILVVRKIYDYLWRCVCHGGGSLGVGQG